jgi:hypothetical protein
MHRPFSKVGLFLWASVAVLSACSTAGKVANQNPTPPAKNQMNRPSREALDRALKQNSGTRVELTNPEPLEEGVKKP